MKRDLDLRLYLIADLGIAGSHGMVRIVAEALKGGVTAVQLRARHASTRDLVTLGRTLLELTAAAGVPLIVNDRADVALAIEADGVHLGADDLPLEEARRLLGPPRIVGATARTPNAVRGAVKAGADYVGARAFFSRTKPEGGEGLGPAGIAGIASVSPVPVVAVGGIRRERVAPLIAAGATGVAVCEAVMAAPDPRQAAQELRDAVDAVSSGYQKWERGQR